MTQNLPLCASRSFYNCYAKLLLQLWQTFSLGLFFKSLDSYMACTLQLDWCSSKKIIATSNHGITLGQRLRVGVYSLNGDWNGKICFIFTNKERQGVNPINIDSGGPGNGTRGTSPGQTTLIN
jgi:hypothetical protein